MRNICVAKDREQIHTVISVVEASWSWSSPNWITLAQYPPSSIEVIMSSISKMNVWMC